MKRYLYQKDYHTPPWAMEYEVESAVENRTMVYVTMFSEELDNTRNAITFTVSSKTPNGKCHDIFRLEQCKGHC